jgi:hypothetical protein
MRDCLLISERRYNDEVNVCLGCFRVRARPFVEFIMLCYDTCKYDICCIGRLYYLSAASRSDRSNSIAMSPMTFFMALLSHLPPTNPVYSIVAPTTPFPIPRRMKIQLSHLSGWNEPATLRTGIPIKDAPKSMSCDLWAVCECEA